jgi:hypothetical protein
MATEMQSCADCRTFKPQADFSPGQWDRSSSRCKCCISARNRKYQRENKSRIKAANAVHYQANRGAILQAAKVRWVERRHLYEPARQAWAEANRDKTLAYFQGKGRQYREWIDSLKEGVPCQDCGDQYPPFVMEYDHVRGIKRHNIGKMANHKRERVLAEIAKCDLVCCVCHRIRSHARRQPPQTTKLLVFKAWINEMKAHPCTDCGRVLPPEAVDFDHVAGDKVSGIAQMWSWSREKVLAELEKCELVCANCHRIRTVESLRADMEEAA